MVTHRLALAKEKGHRCGWPFEMNDYDRYKSGIAGAGFEPATFGLCVPLQLSLPENQFVVWTFSSPSVDTVRVPAIFTNVEEITEN